MTICVGEGQCSGMPHCFTVSPSKPTMKASPQPTFTLDDMKITSFTTDETPETDSFTYNPSFASSESNV